MTYQIADDDTVALTLSADEVREISLALDVSAVCPNAEVTIDGLEQAKNDGTYSELAHAFEKLCEEVAL